MDNVRIFIGTSANGEDAEAEMVYEYSLKKHCSVPVDITWMRQTKDEASIWGGWDTSQWSTPFSGFRWAIPEICEFEGRAIYTDVDMINLRDINELFTADMNGKPLMARRGDRFGGHEFCVMLFDCEAMEDLVFPISRMKNISSSHLRMYHRLSNSIYVSDMDPRWNCLDGEELTISEIWHLHYTNMSTQPWKPDWFTGTVEEHPRKDLIELWNNYRHEAYAAGYKPNKDYEYFGVYDIIGR